MNSAINLVLLLMVASVALTFFVGVFRLWRAGRRMSERDREVTEAMASAIRSAKRPPKSNGEIISRGGSSTNVE